MQRTFVMALRILLTAALAGLACASEGVTVPAGEYAPVLRAASEQATVAVPAFEMDARPVTNAEYAEFVRANPLWRRSKVSRLYADTGYLKHWSSDLVPGASAPVDAPVVNVSWFAARAYARWRGERLPMTAEWERAAKVGYSSEDAEREPAMQEVLGQWLARPSEAPLPAADSGRPNKLGLWNMHGLVWEWVEDFDALLTTNESRSDPALEKELFCGAGSLLARDQGAYFSLLRAGFRSSLKAAYTMPNLGFRCVRSP